MSSSSRMMWEIDQQEKELFNQSEGMFNVQIAQNEMEEDEERTRRDDEARMHRASHSRRVIQAVAQICRPRRSRKGADCIAAYLPKSSHLTSGRRLSIFSMMDTQIQDSVPCRPCIKVEFQLGSETYSVKEHKGILSEQLVYVKEESMRILKDFITVHNVPNDVPDELVENSSDDDGEILEKPPPKSKKTKFT